MKYKALINGTKYKLKIVHDESPENPRDWDGDVTKMICFHDCYRLGGKSDKDHGIDNRDFNGWDDMEKYLIRHFNPIAIKPVYLYDHSMTSLSTKSFVGRAHHAQWDSGRVGFILMTKKEYLSNWGGAKKRVSAKMREHAEKILDADIELYDQYMRGDVYGFILKTKSPDGTKNEDSCYGFYGDDIFENGIADHLPEELREYLNTQNNASN